MGAFCGSASQTGQGCVATYLWPHPRLFREILFEMIVLDKSCNPNDQRPSLIGHEGPFGVHDTMREGIKSFSHDLAPKHPLQSSLKTVHLHFDSDQFANVVGGRG
jgi:hypothetical protein